MDRKSVLILILLGLLCNSCCLPILQDVQRNYSRGFKLKKKQFENEINRIDFNAIYVGRESSFKRMEDGRIEKIETYPFYRFFEGGQYLSGYINHIDNVQSIESLKKYNNLKEAARINKGYFVIKGENITYEFFSFNPQNCGKFIKTKMEIINDSIVGYRKVKIEGLTGSPDW